MEAPLYILHLEDNLNDAELLGLMLAQEGLTIDVKRVETREDFLAGLTRDRLDLIISDFSLPSFDGLSALELARKLRPDIPFIFFSGTLGEEVAVESLKCGATDYVLKDRIKRLGPAVRRALVEAENDRARQRAEEAMTESEYKYRQVFECLGDAALLSDAQTGRILDANQEAEHLLGCSRPEIVGRNWARFHPSNTVEKYFAPILSQGSLVEKTAFHAEVLTDGGALIPVSISAAPLMLYGRHLVLTLYRNAAAGVLAER